MTFSYEYNGKIYTVQIEQGTDGILTAAVKDDSGEKRTYQLNAKQTAKGWHLRLPDGQVTAYAARHKDKRFAHVHGASYEFRVPDLRKVRKYGTGGTQDNALMAQMPGQVTNVLAAAGDVVKRGQTLLVLEAMKMEIRVAAPVDGKVTRISVQKGDVVERGQLVVEVEPTVSQLQTESEP